MNLNVCKECPHLQPLADEEGNHFRMDCSLIYWYKEFFDLTNIAHTPHPTNMTLMCHEVPYQNVPWDRMELEEEFKVPRDCPMKVEHEHPSV